MTWNHLCRRTYLSFFEPEFALGEREATDSRFFKSEARFIPAWIVFLAVERRSNESTETVDSASWSNSATSSENSSSSSSISERSSSQTSRTIEWHQWLEAVWTNSGTIAGITCWMFSSISARMYVLFKKYKLRSATWIELSVKIRKLLWTRLILRDNRITSGLDSL